MPVIIELILRLLEYAKLYFFISYLTDFTYKKGRISKILLGVATIGQCVLECYIPETMPIKYILDIVFVALFFGEKWYKIISCAVWAFVSISFIDSMISSVLNILLEKNDYTNVVVSLISEAIILGYGLLNRKVIGKKRTFSVLYYILFVVVALVNGLMMSLYMENLANMYGENIPLTFIIVAIFALVCFLFEMLAIFWIGAVAISYRERNLFKDEMISAQQQQFELLEQNDETIRRFRHDMMDHLCVLREFFTNKECDAGLEYINSATAMLNSHRAISMNNRAVDAMMNHYVKLAEDKNIPCRIEGLLPHELDVEMFDLCVIYANIMKNAIEAVSELTDNRMITVITSSDANNIYILEKNNYAGDIKAIDGIPQSRKKDKTLHGFGIENIKETVKKYDGNMVINIDNNIFALSLILPYKGSKV